MDVDLMKIAQEMRSKKMHNFYDRQGVSSVHLDIHLTYGSYRQLT